MSDLVVKRSLEDHLRVLETNYLEDALRSARYQVQEIEKQAGTRRVHDGPFDQGFSRPDFGMGLARLSGGQYVPTRLRSSEANRHLRGQTG